MRELIRLEIRKALKNKWFWISMMAGCTAVMLSFIYNVSAYEINRKNVEIAVEAQKDPQISSLTVFNSWVGGESYSLGTTVFFFLSPILSCLAYGWSYAEESVSGYAKQMIVRAGRKNYRIAKYLASFLAGGLAFTLPQLVNLVMILCVIPVRKPIVDLDIYYGVFADFLSGVFYTHPFIYVLLYFLIDFAFCGLTAILCIPVTDLVKRKWVPVLVPFMLYLGVHLVVPLIELAVGNTLGYEYSPFYFLRGTHTRLSISAVPFMVWFLALLMAEAAAYFMSVKRDEF